MIKLSKYLLLTFVLVNFVGCGSGGESSPSIKSVDSISGKVIDSEIVGANVFLDLNKNSILDSNEPHAITNSNGEYKLLLTQENIENENFINKRAFLIASGGYDLKTKETFKAKLKATIDSKIKNITPLTTLVVESLDVNNTNITQNIDEVKFKISKSLNIEVDLLDKNPIQLAIDGQKELLNVSYQIVKFQDMICKESFSSDKEIKGCADLIYSQLAKTIKNKEIVAVNNLLEESSKELTSIKTQIKDSAKIFTQNVEEKIKSSQLYNNETITKTMYEIEEIQKKFSEELKKANPSINVSWKDLYAKIKLSDDYLKKLNVTNLLKVSGYKINDALVDTIIAFKNINLDISPEKFNSYMQELNKLDNFVDDIKLKKIN